MHIQTEPSTAISTVGGTILAVSSLPSKTDFQNTILLAIVGAITSYIVTVAIKKLVSFIKNKFNEKNK